MTLAAPHQALNVIRSYGYSERKTQAASPFRFDEIEFEGHVPIKIRSLPQKEGAVPSAGEDGVNAFSYGSAQRLRDRIMVELCRDYMNFLSPREREEILSRPVQRIWHFVL